MARRPIIAGNWKMNKTIDETKALINALIPLVADAEAEVVFCPPFVNLAAAVEMTEGTNIGIGAQNMHFETAGAFTGEVSGEMLKAIGVKYVIIGHSERRQMFAETDENVNKKVLKALSLGLTPIVCCGETLEEREAGDARNKVVGQIKNGLKEIAPEEMAKVVVAYEPIWAIGTGKTASKEEADEACGWVRETLAEMVGSDVSETVRIQYGGSVNPANASELMSMPNIDGALVGGAALKPGFSQIVKY